MSGLPREFEERMKQMLKEEYQDFVKEYENSHYQSLRINSLKADSQQVKEQMRFSLTPIAWEPQGFYYGDDDAPGKHPYHEAGIYYIQEASAMAPVSLLGPKTGEKILDLCAAPGGKSTQIAAGMQGEGMLFSNEIHPARAKILSENMERMGVRNGIVFNETPQRLAERFPEYFDRILVDAPCSGEGMFRKNNEAVSQWSMENVALCAERQDEILDCAATMLKPGGTLAFSTCTFAPEENEGSISRMLERHPEFTIEPVMLFEGMQPGVAEWINHPAEGIHKTVRLWPHKLKGEGHYAAVLKKKGETKEAKEPKLLKGLKEKECQEYFEFAKETLIGLPQGVFLKFGDQLYLAPEKTPELTGLKVLRPGLHLGTMKKNRFEPSHALALALKPNQVKHSMDLKSHEPEIYKYLRGETLHFEGEKGWYLVCVDGYSIGWGKLAGGILKNHYPKGLRKKF